MWLDNNANNIYVADAINARIRVVSTGGNVTTLAGNGSYGSGGSGTNASFGNMLALTGDGMGNLFLSQEGGGSVWSLPVVGTPITGVLRITEGGGIVSTLAGTTSTTTSTDGDTSSATFNIAGLVAPGLTSDVTGLVYDKANKILYVAYGIYGIRAINFTTGKVSTILPTPDTRAATFMNSSSGYVGPMVEDSKGDLIVCNGFWLYKIQFGQ